MQLLILQWLTVAPAYSVFDTLTKRFRPQTFNSLMYHSVVEIYRKAMQINVQT